MCQKIIINFFLFIQLTQIIKNNFNEIFLSKLMCFFINIYNFHVFYLYFFHLIRSSNCTDFVLHFMLSIKLIKYEFSSFSIIINCDNNIYLSIKLSFKNHNKLTWNIKWTFIFDDNSNSYIYEFILCFIVNYFMNFQLSFFANHFIFKFHVFK